MTSDEQKAAEAFTKWLGQTLLGPHQETFKQEGIAAVLVVGLKESPAGETMTAMSIYASAEVGVPVTLAVSAEVIRRSIEAYKATQSSILLPEKFHADKNRSN